MKRMTRTAAMAVLSACACAAPVSAQTYADFYINDPNDKVHGTPDLCPLRAAMNNIANHDQSGFPNGANPNCPAGADVNFVHFVTPPGIDTLPAVTLDPNLGPIGLDEARVTLFRATIDANGTSGIFDLTGSADVVLDGMILRNAKNSAVTVEGMASLLTDNNTRFVANVAVGDSGAVHFASSGRLSVLKTYFGANAAPNGFAGAMTISGTTQHVQIIQSVFEQNVAKYGGGAVLCTNGATPVGIDGVDFRGNRVTSKSSGSGGAISNNCRMKLRIVGFNGNRVKTGIGGAIAHHGENEFNILTIEDASFVDNRAGHLAAHTPAAEFEVSHGGAVWTLGETSIVRTGFYKNEAQGEGGAVYLSPATTDRRITLANLTFSENEAHFAYDDYPGGAIFIPDVTYDAPTGHLFKLYNSTFWLNEGESQIEIESNGGKDKSAILFVNNIVQDPLGAGVPNCRGRIERLQLRRLGEYVTNTQYPGTSCDQDVDKVPVLDLKLPAQTQFGGFFGQPYAIGTLVDGDAVVCQGEEVAGFDQLLNTRACYQGAAEKPPASNFDAESLLPYEGPGT